MINLPLYSVSIFDDRNRIGFPFTIITGHRKTIPAGDNCLTWKNKENGIHLLPLYYSASHPPFTWKTIKHGILIYLRGCFVHGKGFHTCLKLSLFINSSLPLHTFDKCCLVTKNHVVLFSGTPLK